jgi:MFS superfamily sulfate permease-like transporter
MPVGEYVLEDGKTIVVAQEGIIAEVKETEAVEEEAPMVEEEVEAKTEAPIAKRVVESVSKETFFAAIEKLTNEIEKLKSKQVVELSTEAPEAIVHNPEKKAVKVEFNKRPSTMTSTQQRIYNKLSN